MRVSKAFRCTIPSLRDDQLNNLRLWAERRCAQSALFMDEQGSVVFVALKDEFRTSASFARTVRTALRRMAVDDVRLRGKWLHLVMAREVLAMCEQYGALNAHGGRSAATGREVTADDERDGVKVVTLCT